MTPFSKKQANFRISKAAAHSACRRSPRRWTKKQAALGERPAQKKN
jgi:hypothetical protein